MRILRIQFENLNSLPSGDVDLEHGPLAEAGIFAITGPTGAGKSTLLDALTLALYGRAARYDKEPNPENMMSRHTGSCRAEVLFEVPRGRFQARWELRRARGKADGKVQAARRSIVEDGTGTVLAQKIDEADRLVEELTGLDFERFRRSVLLAQGEFTRFLKAKPDERAELLESLTGTSIYSELSERAFREATRREDDLAMRREALGRVVLLTGEERDAKTSQIGQCSAELDGLEGRRAVLTQQLASGLQLRDRLHEQAELAATKAVLEAEALNAAPALERLRVHRLTVPFLAPLETLDALDRRKLAETLQTGEAETAATQASERLAAGWGAFQAVVHRLLGETDAVIARAEENLRALGDALAHAETSEKTALAEARHAAATLGERQQNRTEEGIAVEFARLEQKRNALFELRAAMEKRDAAAAEAARLADEETLLVQEIETARREKEATLQEAEALAALLEDARVNLALQERIAGLADQRADLEEGRPCPLCGAVEHPYAYPGALPSSPIEEARRHLNAAKTANDTGSRESRLAAEGLTRTEERLSGVQKRRGEIRWEQTADHEAFEKAARSVRIFTVEGLEEAFADLSRERAAHEALAREIREAEARNHAAEKALLTWQGKTAQLRGKWNAAETALGAALSQREALCRESERAVNTAAADGLAVGAPDPLLVERFAARWATLDAASTAMEPLRRVFTETVTTAGERRKSLEGVCKAVEQQAETVRQQLAGSAFADVGALRAARLEAAEARRIEALEMELAARGQELEGRFHHVREQIHALRDGAAPEGDALAALEQEQRELAGRINVVSEARTTLRNDLARDEEARRSQTEEWEKLETEERGLAVWVQLRRLIGSANGAAFRQFAQGLSLDILVRHANRHLARLSDRYRLRRVEGELTLEIIDRHQADATRPMQSLSGGESFLASLALALGLSDLAGRNVRIDSLFIDEGFGSLDADSLDLAVAALDALRLHNKTIGIISHVELLKERIPVQIRVEKRTGGTSVLRLPV